MGVSRGVAVTHLASAPGDPVEIAEQWFEEASRLLAMTDSADAFIRGTALVEQAAESGHAEAAAFLATLEAIGAGRRQNWAAAFSWLARASERGSARARAQLRLLSRSGPDDQDWEAMRERIDFAALLRAPAQIALSERPRLRVLPGFASTAECDWIIAAARPGLGPALVWDEATGAARADPARNGSALELRLANMGVVTEFVRARIAAATGLPELIFEVPQIMHYVVGQEFRPHHDFLDPGFAGHRADLARRGQRMGTFLIYLNEDFEGGETAFPQAGIAHRGRRGDALFFANVLPTGQPDPLTLHAGRPPASGEKWLFSQWIRDRAPGPA